MAEFALPANSKIGVGETYKAAAGVKNIKTFNPLRVATHEYTAIWQDVRAAKTWKQRFGHTFRGPGWSPDSA